MEGINSIEKSEDVKVINNWDEYELKDDLLRGIYANGFDSPSQIQKTAILPVIQKRDIIAQAPSGTGKTATFAIGALQRIDTSVAKTQVLILAPTHELVKQISSVVTTLGNMMKDLKTKTLVGGTSVMEDAEDLRKNVPHIIIGSVGRVNDMVRRRNIKMNDIKMFVLDEADEMLSGGFIESVHYMFQCLNSDVQVAVFSATMPPEMLELTSKFMRNPVKITIEAEKLNLEGISQYYIALSDDNSKFDTLKDLLGQLSVNQMIIYSNSVNRVIDLYDALIKENFAVCCLHSTMPSHERKAVLQDFRGSKYRIMISSDVTARGIDVQQVSTVINFDVPRNVNTYLHRIGRSGRWGRKGMAINFVTRQDIGNLKNIESHYKSNIEELPGDFATKI